MRTTIVLDDALVERLRSLLPARGLNRFINDTLTEKVDALEQQAIREAMKAGYLAEQREQYEVSADWATLDVEGWPQR